MSKTIRLSDELALPLEFATESTAIVAVKRAGKSHTAKRLVEQLHAAGQQVVVVDPKGDWWGIRSSADGKQPGLPLVILGGQHGDVPLEPNHLELAHHPASDRPQRPGHVPRAPGHGPRDEPQRPGSGELVARMVVEQTVSVLIDLSDLSKAGVATFMAAFLEQLYRLKNQEQYRTPLTLVVDEADAIAPQKPQPGIQLRMLGAIDDCVRRGGQRGIGIVMITQRTAVLNKDVLTQCGILMLLRMTGSQDIDAVDHWIKKHGQAEKRGQVMADIAALPRGDVWVWAPGWPDGDGIFQRTHVAPCWTFDSGRTPKAGERRTAPKTRADVDLAAFRKEMAATIEKAKADDPRALRAQIASLERELTKARAQHRTTLEHLEAAESLSTKTEKVNVLKDGQLARAEKLLERLHEASRKATEMGGQINAAVIELAGAIMSTKTPAAPAPARGSTTQIVPRQPAAAPIVGDTYAHHLARHDQQRGARVAPTGDDVSLTDVHRRVLNAAAFLHSIGIQAPPPVQLGVFSKVNANGGYWRAVVGKLRTQGLMTGTTLTDAGRALAQPSDITSTVELHEYLLNDVCKPKEAAILRVLLDIWPHPLSAADLGQRAGVEPNGGYWRALIGRLRTAGLMTKTWPAKAQDYLFLDGR